MRPRGRLCHAAWARAFVALVTTFEDVSLGTAAGELTALSP